MATETMINDAARKGSAQQSKLVSQQSNISDAFTRATIAERMIQEVTDRQVGTQKALVAKTETAIQTQMQAKSSGVDLDMLKQMSSVGYKSLHGEAATDLFKANALLDHILDPSLTIAWKVFVGEEKPANEIRETIKLDQRYLFDHAKTTLASRIDQLDKGTAPKDVNWGMEAVVAGSMYKGINVEKRVETLYNLSVQKGQLTSAQQKELGDIYDLTSSNFIVHASTMGSMSMEKVEFQKGLERIAEGQTYLGYTLINGAVGKMAQYNLDAGVGVSNYNDPANTRFNIESKGGVAAGDVAVGSTVGSITVAPVAAQSVSQSTKQPVASVEGFGSAKPQGLMDELVNSGVKHNPSDVVMVTKSCDGKLLWLENGNVSSGLKHIVNGHAANFSSKGITDIPDFLHQTLQNTPYNTGMGAGGPFSDYMMNDSTYRVAYGTNGYIVSFYPID